MSATGDVFAIAKTAVNPPAAAARVPVSDGLALLVARLSQVRVEVDEAGQRDQPVGIEHRRADGIGVAADPGDDAVLEQDVGALAVAQRRPR